LNSLGGKITFEKWMGKIPDVNCFKELDEVYTLNRDPTKRKFDPRFKRIFVGYSEQSKIYLCGQKKEGSHEIN